MSYSLFLAAAGLIFGILALVLIVTGRSIEGFLLILTAQVLALHSTVARRIERL